MSNSFMVSYPAGGVIDVIKKISQVDTVDKVNFLETVDTVNSIGVVESIRGFASNTQPYNKMELVNVKAGSDIVDVDITLPDQVTEILAISVTCSGYGEDDKFDLWVNEHQVFENWYCSEVKEGLFLGTSTWVYTVPPSSTLRLRFYNSSHTSKKLWLGVRMIINPIQQDSDNNESVSGDTYVK